MMDGEGEMSAPRGGNVQGGKCPEGEMSGGEEEMSRGKCPTLVLVILSFRPIGIAGIPRVSVIFRDGEIRPNVVTSRV